MLDHEMQPHLFSFIKNTAVEHKKKSVNTIFRIFVGGAEILLFSHPDNLAGIQFANTFLITWTLQHEVQFYPIGMNETAPPLPRGVGFPLTVSPAQL